MRLGASRGRPKKAWQKWLRRIGLSSQYQNVYFEPLDRRAVLQQGSVGRKVLVLGESHYDEWADDPSRRDVTTKHQLTRTFLQQCFKSSSSSSAAEP
jgi:hypothetical protein